MKLFRKKVVAVPTAMGWLVLFLAVVLLACGLLSGLYRFLYQNQAIDEAPLAIVEGWLPDAELETLCKTLPPSVRFITTGGPIRFGGSLFKEKSYAEITASRLRAFGIADERIISAPAPDFPSDRTYHAALAVRQALAGRGISDVPANLYTLGAHARRSFLLYRVALDGQIPLGVVSLESSEVDLSRWWASSEAFRHLTGESLAWLYVQLTRWKYNG